MTTVNHFVNDCANLNFLPLFLLHRSSLEVRVQLLHLGLIIPHLRLLLRTFPRMYLYLCPHLRLLSRTFSGMYSYFWRWRMSMQQSGLSLPFVFVSLLYDLLSFLFHRRLFIWNQNCLGMKDLLFVLLGFPRQASPESSEPNVALDSRSSLIRTTFGVHTSFFPGSHLRVSHTPRVFRFT